MIKQDCRGFSLVELLVVILAVALVLAISVPFSKTLVDRYRAENQMRTIYGDMMEARQRAMQRNVPHIIQFAQNGFTVYEDRDGDGVPDANEKIPNLSITTLSFTLNGTVGGLSIPSTPSTTLGLLTASRKGLLEPDTVIRIDSPRSPCNCVVTGTTRLGLGKYDGTNCVVQ
ncbi:MAG: prepilin-type N-terminal cleavage/methylation domain-containing protein [Acidobacteriota bacterium]